MVRGFIWRVYVDDDGGQWALLVDADYATHVERGWDNTDPVGKPPLPRAWLPRKVVGIDPTGRTLRAIVARTSALLWTGASSSFAVEANDGTTVICTVISRMQEDRSRRP